MEDSSLDSTAQDTDKSDLAVDLDTLSIDGTRPKAGDTVELKVSGSISQIKNNTAFVTPERVNDQPIPSEQPDAPDDETASMMAAAGKADTMGMGY